MELMGTEAASDSLLSQQGKTKQLVARALSVPHVLPQSPVLTERPRTAQAGQQGLRWRMTLRGERLWRWQSFPAPSPHGLCREAARQESAASTMKRHTEFTPLLIRAG